MNSIDVRIGRFRLSFDMPWNHAPSAVELDEEVRGARSERFALYEWQHKAIDVLRAALRGEPEDEPALHPAECAAALIRRLRDNLEMSSDKANDYLDRGCEYESIIQAVADELGLAYDERNKHAMLCAIRSLRAKAAPLVKSEAAE